MSDTQVKISETNMFGAIPDKECLVENECADDSGEAPAHEDEVIED